MSFVVRVSRRLLVSHVPIDPAPQLYYTATLERRNGCDGSGFGRLILPPRVRSLRGKRLCMRELMQFLAWTTLIIRSVSSVCQLLRSNDVQARGQNNVCLVD